MTIAVVRYNAGNVQSVMHALNRVGADPVLTDDAEVLQSASKVIFPGVGEASTAMRHLRERGLDKVIRALRQPVLGVCLGMQLLCVESEENDTQCLGVFADRVERFRTTTLKVPHVGWNSLQNVKGPLFSAELEDRDVYFVHSYMVPLGECTSATCTYDVPFSAALQRENFFGVQFHPEKSGTVGERILRSFLCHEL